jgi:hypothetical protein
MSWPDGDQGYGAGGQGPQNNGGWYGYPPPGGPGGYGPPPGFPPPRRSPVAGIVVAIVIIAGVLLVGVAIGGIVLLSGGHENKQQPVTVQAPSVQPSAEPSSAPPAQAKVPGWKAVVAVKHGVTYDVPPSWSVKPPGVIIGFEDPNGKPQVGGSGAATYKEGYCQGHSGSWRAATAVTGYVTTDPAADAKDAARKWATNGYAPDSGGSAPTVAVGAPRPISVGGVTGQEATATVTVRDRRNPCSPPGAVVHTVAMPPKNGQVAVLIVIADQSVSDAAADADLQKIAGSLRPTA